MNNKRRRAMARQRRAEAEYEDWVESRKKPEKLVRIGEILRRYEHHKEEESEDGIMYIVLFDNNMESRRAISELVGLGCECHNESRDWDDYDGEDIMWAVCWDYETIYG